MRIALYRIHDGDGRLLYVGVTSMLGRRIKSHERTSSWWVPDPTVTVTWYESRDEALVAEGMAIRLERPLWNRTHLSGLSTSWIYSHWCPASKEQSIAAERAVEAVRLIEKADDAHWAGAKERARAALAAALDSGVPIRVLAKLARAH